MADHTTRFDGKGDIYAKARPRYAPALFEYLHSSLNIEAGAVFADIGSGTGIFSEQLLQQGYRVFAVEPNGDMRKKAEEKLGSNPNFTSVNGKDSNTGLAEQSVDHITAAQAFHWFDAEAFRRECRRILKQNGKIILAYNARDEQAESNKALAELCRKYNPEFHGFSGGIKEETCLDFYGGNCEVFCCDNSQVYNRQGYIDRVLSSSYSLREKDSGFEAYLEEINKLFDRFAVDGVMTVPMHTIAYIG